MVKKTLLILSSLICIVLSALFVRSIGQIWIIPVSFLASFLGLFCLFMLMLFIMSLFIDTKKEYEPTSKFNRFLMIITMEMLYQFAGAKLKVTGLEKLPKNQKFMFVFNHKSKFDPIIQTVVLKNYNLVHISKPSNFKAPIAGPFMKRCGYLSIDRENSKNGLKTILKAISLIKDDVSSIGVSPEGTRNYGEGLLPFRAGCFKIALKAECPIVICTMRNTLDIHKNFPFKKTLVEMRIVRVLSYDEIKDLNTFEISDIVRREMLKDLNIVEEKDELHII